MFQCHKNVCQSRLAGSYGKFKGNIERDIMRGLGLPLDSSSFWQVFEYLSCVLYKVNAVNPKLDAPSAKDVHFIEVPVLSATNRTDREVLRLPFLMPHEIVHFLHEPLKQYR